jgi:glucokinase
VHVVAHPAPGLLGAALCAARPVSDQIARGA